MFTGIICTIISTKSKINPLAVTLFSGSGPKAMIFSLIHPGGIKMWFRVCSMALKIRLHF